MNSIMARRLSESSDVLGIFRRDHWAEARVILYG
jgi:hypothetical protein